MASTYGTGIYGSLDGTYGILTTGEQYTAEVLDGVLTIARVEIAGSLVTVIEAVGS